MSVSAGKSGQNRSTKDKQMAAALKSKGIYHGMRPSVTLAPPVPRMSDVGSACYRRYLESLRTKRLRESA